MKKFVQRAQLQKKLVDTVVRGLARGLSSLPNTCLNMFDVIFLMFLLIIVIVDLLLTNQL